MGGLSGTVNGIHWIGLVLSPSLFLTLMAEATKSYFCSISPWHNAFFSPLAFCRIKGWRWTQTVLSCTCPEIIASFSSSTVCRRLVLLYYRCGTRKSNRVTKIDLCPVMHSCFVVPLSTSPGSLLPCRHPLALSLSLVTPRPMYKYIQFIPLFSVILINFFSSLCPSMRSFVCSYKKHTDRLWNRKENKNDK